MPRVENGLPINCERALDPCDGRFFAVPTQQECDARPFSGLRGTLFCWGGNRGHRMPDGVSHSKAAAARGPP
jgi:hypothetical protein